MAQVHPFRAYRYNPAHVAFEQVLTQPYDKISPAMQEQYYSFDPHNLIAVEKGRVFPDDSPEENVYTRGAAALESWIRSQVVTPDTAPAFYAYSQEYTVPGTDERRTRRGFIGAGKLEDYSAGVVFRHEQTLSGPKADRLELLRHTRTHTGQLFMLYSDPARRVDAILEEAAAAGPPATDVRDEYGVLHRLWIISDPARVAKIQRAMADQKLVIADGHHRYETALNYRNECRARASVIGEPSPDAPCERAMMTFINTRSEGLTVLPTHRVVSRLPEFSWEKLRGHLHPWFELESFAYSTNGEQAEARTRFLDRLAASPRRAIGVAAAGAAPKAYFLLTLRPGADPARLLPNVSPLQSELDVVLLHRGILEAGMGITPQSVSAEANLAYERDAVAAMEAVDRGVAQIAFLLNPVDVEQVMRIATAGEVMPQKSTDFYPKLLSGITMYRVE
jgi:uncharacterized protein (DUF1015 family)